MKLKTSVIIASLTTLLACVVVPNQSYNFHQSAVPTFTQRILIKGSAGDDVYELQGRLQYVGFYKGKIDGAFGWSTYWAVRNFQDRFGIRVDGIVGPQTKNKLVQATRNYHHGQGRSKTASQPKQHMKHSSGKRGSSRVSDNDMKLIANAVYGESRGESFIGQVAVAAVILNRLEDPRFPHSVSGIIFQPGAFTAVSDGQIWLTPNTQAEKAVQDALNGFDPSDGAVYYFNPATATSKWIWSRPQIKKIGKHIFCR